MVYISHMRYRDIFHLIADVCKKNSISCVLIGGFAVNYYKVTRQTADVDFLIVKDDYKKISNLLEKEGFKEDQAQKVFARLVPKDPRFMDLDFMFVDKNTIDKIIKSGKTVKIAGESFIVPSLLHLIALKLHAIKYNPKVREFKDFLDIVELIKTNKVNIKNSEFRDICLKYGTKELCGKIKSWIGQ